MTQDDSDLLRRLLSIEAIKNLKARYFRAIDTKDWEQFGLVFSRDAVMEVPEADIVETGRESIVAAVSGPLTGARTVHHGHMPEINITGPTTATGTWAMFDYVEWAKTPETNRFGLMGYGHYLEEYIREDDEWRIAKLHLRRLRVDFLPVESSD